MARQGIVPSPDRRCNLQTMIKWMDTEAGRALFLSVPLNDVVVHVGSSTRSVLHAYGQDVKSCIYLLYFYVFLGFA